MCDCSICIAEKEIRLCKNIAKFLQNLPFQLAKFCILDAKFEIIFCKKPRGQTDRETVAGGERRGTDCESQLPVLRPCVASGNLTGLDRE